MLGLSAASPTAGLNPNTLFDIVIAVTPVIDGGIVMTGDVDGAAENDSAPHPQNVSVPLNDIVVCPGGAFS